jgi:predicted Zn-dependent protease
MSNENFLGSQMGARFMQLVVALLIAVVGIGFIAIRGCQEGPFGRKQIVTLNAEQEVALGAQAFNEVLHDARVVRSGEVVKQVQSVTGRLVKATRDPAFVKITHIKDRGYKWEVQVVQSQERNAFCLPGGKMVVYTGILPICKTESGLATVMGHEISHALARHGAERMSQQQMVQIGMGAAGAGMGGMRQEDRARMMQILNAGAKFGILRYSRRHESEADHLGLLLMAAAGFDPQQSVKFWERMRAAAGKGKAPPEFMSTHPSHETRIHDLLKWMPQAEPLYRSSPDRDLPDEVLRWPPR